MPCSVPSQSSVAKLRSQRAESCPFGRQKGDMGTGGRVRGLNLNLPGLTHDGNPLFNKHILNVPVHGSAAGTEGHGKVNEALSLSPRNL